MSRSVRGDMISVVPLNFLPFALRSLLFMMEGSGSERRHLHENQKFSNAYPGVCLLELIEGIPEHDWTFIKE